MPSIHKYSGVDVEVKLPTAADRAKQRAQQNWRSKDLENKTVQVNVRVPMHLQENIKLFASLLRAGRSPLTAFIQAFPEDAAGVELLRGTEK